MKTTETRSMMSSLRNRKGFSLVEMAIVLVIIGIIIAAIVKGQDLMINANAKKVISATQTWRVLAMAYLDRNGRLPGDGNKDGVIGNQQGAVFKEMSGGTGAAITELRAVMTNAPANPIIAGGATFYAYFGNVPGMPLTGGTNRNVVILCKNAACDKTFTNDDREILKAMDTALDGSADATVGQFRATKTAEKPYDPSVTLVANFATFKNYSAVAAGEASPAYTSWGDTDIVAAVWAFDAPF